MKKFIRAGIALALAVSMLLPALPVQAQEAAWLDGWGKRVKLTIDDGLTALTDFPVTIHISSSSGTNNKDLSFVFDELLSDVNRLKIAVTGSDGTTQYYVEIEDWDTVSEDAWLHVKVPLHPETLYLYYDVTQDDN